LARTKKRQQQMNKIHKARNAKRRAQLVIQPDDFRTCIPAMNVPESLKLIADRDPSLWMSFFEYFQFFEKHHYMQYGKSSIQKINDFVSLFFTACQRDDYLPAKQYLANLIQCGHILQHLVAVSSYRTTNSVLDASLMIEGNVPKIMTLQNPRCDLQLNQEKLFDIDPQSASIWYMMYLLGISATTAKTYANMHRHLELMDERWIPPHNSVSGLYFGCTYINPGAVRRVKSIMNKGIKAKGVPTFTNNPDPKSIAIVTERWHRNHAVYKSQSPLLEQLKDDYKLTLVWTNPPDQVPPTIVKDYFDDVCHMYFKPDGSMVIPDKVKNNDFAMVYYPDIGMSDESIWMSNMRIAPIQAVGYGHPDTTGDNNEIDYFIGGHVEKDAGAAYSETQILIPGLAQEPAWPSVERQNNYIDDGIVRINCVWGPDKYNHPLLMMLAEINKAVYKINPDSKHEFNMYGSPGLNRYAALPVFNHDVKTLLPNAKIHSQWEYVDYMREAEKSDFALNSFPFGCYNVLVESLWMGLPFLSLVGDRFYNKAGAYLNERVGMEENNFHDPQGMIAKAAELITNPEALKKQREHLAALDLKERLFTLEGKHFLGAVDHILANHPINDTTLIGEQQ